jgi:hypothetical protein
MPFTLISFASIHMCRVFSKKQTAGSKATFGSSQEISMFSTAEMLVV